MTLYLLDTNIISDVVKPTPNPALAKWMFGQEDASLFISSITLGEIIKGINQLPKGKKRTHLEEWFNGPQGPAQLFSGRVLDFDSASALAWGKHLAQDKATGNQRGPIDVMIGSIAQVNGCVVATLNEKDFHRFEALNPTKVPEGS